MSEAHDHGQRQRNPTENGKATGLNMIPNKILKCSKDVISQSLADIFNTNSQSGIFPDDFKIEAE